MMAFIARASGRWWFVAGALLLLCATGREALAQDVPAIANAESSAPALEAALHGAELVSALRKGGYVVYFRHAATDFSKNDAGMTGFDDCEHQRPLSDPGRRDAAQIGQRIRTLGLARGEVLASPMCRTREHAQLMMAEVSPRNDVREAADGEYAGLKRLLASPVRPGTNRWIVGHGMPFRAVAGPPQLAEGEAVVIRPATTHWTVVARLTVADWQALRGRR